MDLKGAQMPIRPSYRGRGDVVPGLDAREVTPHDAGDHEIRRHGDGYLLPCLGCDDKALPLDPVNRATDAGRDPLCCLGEGRENGDSDEQSRQR